MSKRTEQEYSEEYNDLTEFDIAEDDFGFLIDSDGNLKTVFGPNALYDTPPENVQRILEMFGVNSSDLIARSGVTLH
jgi:hypothetical protein